MQRMDPVAVAAVAAWLGLWGGACVVDNPSHCANRHVDETCAQLYGQQAPLCSECVAANDGCVANVEPGCRPQAIEGTDSAAMGTEGSVTSSASLGTSNADTSAGATSTTDAESGAAAGSVSETRGSASGTTTGLETSGTAGGPSCGDGVIEGSEECDGNAFGGETCQSVLGQRFSYGTLMCTGDCTIDAAACCVPDGGSCQSVADCCRATACTGVDGSKCSL